MNAWKHRLLGRRDVELREVTPHGGDLHLVVATVDGKPFRNYVPTGDIAALGDPLFRTALAARVRRLARESAR